VVAVLVFDRSPLFEMSVPLSVFTTDVSPGGHRFELRSVAAEPGPLRTTGGLEIRAPYELDALGTAGIVVVPAWRDPRERPGEPVLAALRAAHADGAVIVGLCLGAFVVAAAGLLDGRRAATHWAFTGALAAAYPKVTVDPAALFVDEGDVLTSAGAAAGIDACLHLVRRMIGAGTAAAIARRMVVSPQRSGTQAQYLDQPVPERVDDDMFAVLAHALENLGSPLDVEGMAARAHMSRRAFDRKFRAAVGDSPMKWLLHQRVLHAQRLLEGTDLSVDAIARHVGLGAGVSLRPHFRRQVGTSPQAYRQAFRAIDASGRLT
jgi:transcriptional regulator GlxA family with amidase domain